MEISYKFMVMAAACVASAAFFTIRRSRKKDVISLILKVVASMCFVMLGFYCALWADNFDTTGIVIIGLIFGMLGDIFLDLKYVDGPNSTAYTSAGFLAFIFGHIFYITFLTSDYPWFRYGINIALIVGIAGAVLIYVSPKLLKLDYGRFRLLSALYAGILIYVTTYAGVKAFADTNTFTVMFFIGLLCFLASDLILSQIYFGKDKDTPLLGILNHSLYYIGQILIAASLYFYFLETVTNNG